MCRLGGVTYLHGDHLGSTSKTTGAASSAQLYEAYGAQRGSSEVDTPYQYTGQKWEENDALDVYPLPHTARLPGVSARAKGAASRC